ncbi:MAG: hypothetical protein PHW04_05765 [Candidatus Wallbacteria bacterium]|nr:hypothetical protein [Candidatus Wallbacteria bacterium]
MAGALAKVLENPGKLAGMGLSARLKVEERHDLEKMAVQIAETYREILGVAE